MSPHRDRPQAALGASALRRDPGVFTMPFMLSGFILVLIAVAAAASTPAAPRLHVLRELPGDPALVDVAAGVLPLGDGALITGWTARAGAPPQGLLVRVDAEANVLWRREPGGTGTDLLFATHADGRGGFVCAGFTNSAGAGGSDGWILGLDSAGATRWERTFGGPGNERLSSLQPARDGWMAAGQTERDGNTVAWVVRLDREGGDLGAWTWGGAGTQRGLSVQPLADGGCVIAGGAGESRESSDGFVTRLGADGRPVWAHAVGCAREIAEGMTLAVIPRHVGLRVTVPAPLLPQPGLPIP